MAGSDNTIGPKQPGGQVEQASSSQLPEKVENLSAGGTDRLTLKQILANNKEKVAELMKRSPIQQTLEEIARASLTGRPTEALLKRQQELLKNFQLDFDPEQVSLAKPDEGSPEADALNNGRPVMIVSFDLDDNLFDSSHVMRDLVFDVLTSDEYWPRVQQSLGNISKENFGLKIVEDFFGDPAPYHGLPSLASGWADTLNLDDRSLYETLIKEYDEICKDCDNFGIVLGSKDFFNNLEAIRQEYDAKGVDVIYILATNKEKSVAATQLANMMVRGKMPASVFDAMIGWDGEGPADVYRESDARKPNPAFIYNALNTHRTEESKEKVPFMDPEKQDVTFIHIGDSPTSDVNLANEIKKDNPEMTVKTILPNTTGIAHGPDALLKIAEECKACDVHLRVTSRAVYKDRNINDELKALGAQVSRWPSTFSYLDEPSDRPRGDEVGQARILTFLTDSLDEILERAPGEAKALQQNGQVKMGEHGGTGDNQDEAMDLMLDPGSKNVTKPDDTGKE